MLAVMIMHVVLIRDYVTWTSVGQLLHGWLH
jgi:hypothetical protein